MITQDAPTDVDTPSEGEEPACGGGSRLLKPVRQAVIFVLGISVVIVGIAMIVLPGPATVVIPAGLAILATEFVWARRWLNYLKQRAQKVAEWTVNTVSSTANAQRPQSQRDEALTKR